MKSEISILTALFFSMGNALCDSVEKAPFNNQELGKRYAELWNAQVNSEIDARIERYRKADGTAGGFAPGTAVQADQMTSAFQFGANIFNFDQLGNDVQNAMYKAAFTNLLNAATIPFYWNKFEPQQGHPRYLAGVHDTAAFWNSCPEPTKQPEWRRPAPEPIIQFCEANQIAMHGHVILYPPYGPKWLPKTDGEELQRLFRKRVEEICLHYKGRIPQWDVVNESVNRSCTVNNPNDDICWGNKSIAVPKDYTFTAYQLAEKLFPPSVKLVINDSWRPIYPPFIRSLMQRGAKIDVVGIQMHIFSGGECLKISRGEKCKANGTSWEPQDQIAMLKALDELKRPIHLSEVTIPSPENSERGDAIQARMLRDNYRLWFSWPSIYRITYWNLVDSVGGEILRSGFFTRNMQRKAAYQVLDQLIQHEWKTHVNVTADASGNISFRGFRGRYRLTGKDRDGKPVTKMIEL